MRFYWRYILVQHGSITLHIPVSLQAIAHAPGKRMVVFRQLLLLDILHGPKLYIHHTVSKFVLSQGHDHTVCSNHSIYSLHIFYQRTHFKQKGPCCEVWSTRSTITSARWGQKKSENSQTFQTRFCLCCTATQTKFCPSGRPYERHYSKRTVPVSF